MVRASFLHEWIDTLNRVAPVCALPAARLTGCRMDAIVLHFIRTSGY